MSGRRVSDATKIKEKRGQGSMQDYIPWIKINEVSSKGRKHRVLSNTVGRIHHLLSDLEYYYFLTLDYDDDIVDIREQYPLDLHDTVQIAQNLGLRHPRDYVKKEYYIMSTDFMITSKSGVFKAKTIKPSIKLEEHRVIDKFDIEQHYFENLGIDWEIITEKEINRQMAKSIEDCNYFYKRNSLEPKFDDDQFYITSVRELFTNTINNLDIPQIEILKAFERKYALEKGSGIALYKHLIANKIIKIDFNEPIKYYEPPKLLQNESFLLEV